MKNLFKGIAFILLCVVGITACKKDTDTTTNNTTTPTDTTQVAIPSNLIKIGETYVIGASAKAIVYGEKLPEVGYNKLYVALYDSTTNARLKDGHFELIPEMTMTSMTHSSPVENEEETAPSDQLFKANAVFTMPSTAGSWALHIHFHNHKNNLEGEGELAINVTLPTILKLVSFTDSTMNNKPIFVSLIQPTAPKIGGNTYEVVAHSKLTNDSFPPVTDYEIAINPIMVSMGHSSPGNINPTHTDIGHYSGKVNFSMTGLWRVYMTIKRNNAIVKDSAYFDFEF